MRIKLVTSGGDILQPSIGTIDPDALTGITLRTYTDPNTGRTYHYAGEYTSDHPIMAPVIYSGDIVAGSYHMGTTASPEYLSIGISGSYVSVADYTSNGVYLNAIGYQNQYLGFFQCYVDGVECIGIAVCSSTGSVAFGVGYFMLVSSNYFEEAEQPPYQPTDDTAAGDPDEQGGYGNGFPAVSGNDPTATKSTIFPIGIGTHVYGATPAQLGALSDKLWGRDSTVFAAGGLWGKFENYKFNPMAGLLSVHTLPLALVPTPSGSSPINIAGTTLLDCSASPITTQWTSWASDTINVPEPWGSYLDYLTPEISVHLPFIGTIPIDVNAVMGGYFYVKYWCDVINGNCAAYIIGKGKKNSSAQIIKTATGNCAYQLPMTGNDNGVGDILGTLKQTVVSGFTGSVGGIAGAGFDLGLGTARHHTQTMGSCVGNAGYADSTEVYAIFEWTYPVYSDNYNAERGRPSEYSATVGSFSGYSELEIHADSIANATEEEKREIEQTLLSGVII